MSQTEVSYILHARRSSANFKECDYLKEKRITVLDDLLKMSDAEWKALAEEQAKKIRQDILKIQQEYKESGEIFLTETAAPAHRGPNVFYKHWLPLVPTRLLGVEQTLDDQNWNEVLANRYEEFDTLCHATHINTTAVIFQENDLKANPVQDNSVFSKVPGHPNADTKVIWFGPAMKGGIFNMDCKYGNTAFFMRTLEGYEGIWREPGDFNYYFVEVIDYQKQSACRILVTPKTYPHLRPYDPTKKGGPWYYDTSNNKHYWLKNVKRYDGEFNKNGNSLEIMRELHDEPCRVEWFRENLLFCPINHIRCIKSGCDCEYKNLRHVDLMLYVLYKTVRRPSFTPFPPEEILKTKIEKLLEYHSGEGSSGVEKKMLDKFNDCLKLLGQQQLANEERIALLETILTEISTKSPN